MDLHAIDVELQEFNYDDMKKLAIKDPEDREVDDASISTEMSVWKTGQDKTENSERVKQDKLDLNLSSKFLDTVGKPEHREIFALDSTNDNDSSSMSSSSTTIFETLDDCVNESYESETTPLANLIRGHPIKQSKTADLQPIAFVRFTTSLGKPKPVTTKALLDSGGSESLVTKKFLKNLRLKKSSNSSTTWTTPGGEMRTNQKVKAQFTMPELHEDRLIEWNLHIVKALGKHDMTIGGDILQFLKIDLRFSDNVAEWDGSELPFKDD